MDLFEEAKQALEKCFNDLSVDQGTAYGRMITLRDLAQINADSVGE